MRKTLCTILAALCLTTCRGKEEKGPVYRSIYRPLIVGVSSYRVAAGESMYTLLESELQGSEPFTALPWPHLGVHAIPEDRPPPVQEYDFVQILGLLNNRRLTPTTALRIGEAINFPDLNYDGLINRKRGEYRGLLMFSGVLDPVDPSYFGRDHRGGKYWIALRVQ